MRVLIAEDEESLARGLKYLLEKNRFTVDTAANGIDALVFFSSNVYDAVVLDIMMPGKNGIEVLSEIRREGSGVPVMMLTAKSSVEDRVAGLEAGADDYLPKPFSTAEFVARVKALCRRSTVFSGAILTVGNTSLNCSTYEISVSGTGLRLNNKEFQMMEVFMKHPHFVFSTEKLMDMIWGQESDSDLNVVWTYVGFLRKKFKTIGSDIEIRTVRGAGYSLEISE